MDIAATPIFREKEPYYVNSNVAAVLLAGIGLTATALLISRIAGTQFPLLALVVGGVGGYVANVNFRDFRYRKITEASPGIEVITTTRTGLQSFRTIIPTTLVLMALGRWAAQISNNYIASSRDPAINAAMTAIWLIFAASMIPAANTIRYNDRTVITPRSTLNQAKAWASNHASRVAAFGSYVAGQLIAKKGLSPQDFKTTTALNLGLIALRSKWMKRRDLPCLAAMAAVRDLEHNTNYCERGEAFKYVTLDCPSTAKLGYASPEHLDHKIFRSSAGFSPEELRCILCLRAAFEGTGGNPEIAGFAPPLNCSAERIAELLVYALVDEGLPWFKPITWFKPIAWSDLADRPVHPLIDIALMHLEALENPTPPQLAVLGLVYRGRVGSLPPPKTLCLVPKIQRLNDLRSLSVVMNSISANKQTLSPECAVVLFNRTWQVFCSTLNVSDLGGWKFVILHENVTSNFRLLSNLRLVSRGVKAIAQPHWDLWRHCFLRNGPGKGSKASNEASYNGLLYACSYASPKTIKSLLTFPMPHGLADYTPLLARHAMRGEPHAEARGQAVIFGIDLEAVQHNPLVPSNGPDYLVLGTLVKRFWTQDQAVNQISSLIQLGPSSRPSVDLMLLLHAISTDEALDKLHESASSCTYTEQGQTRPLITLAVAFWHHPDRMAKNSFWSRIKLQTLLAQYDDDDPRCIFVLRKYIKSHRERSDVISAIGTHLKQMVELLPEETRPFWATLANEPSEYVDNYLQYKKVT